MDLGWFFWAWKCRQRTPPVQGVQTKTQSGRFWRIWWQDLAAGSFFELNGDTEINGIFNIGDRTKAKRCKTCFETHVKKARFQLRGFRGGGRLFLEIFGTKSLPAENLCPTWRWKWFCCSCPFNFVPRTVRCPLCARMMCCNCLREWFVPSSRVAWLASFFWVSYATNHRNHSFKRWMTTSGMTTRVPLYLWSLSHKRKGVNLASIIFQGWSRCWLFRAIRLNVSSSLSLLKLTVLGWRWRSPPHKCSKSGRSVRVKGPTKKQTAGAGPQLSVVTC